MKGDIVCSHELTLKRISDALSMFPEEDLRLYKDLGNDLYELPGIVITNKKGLEKYLKELKNEANRI